MSDTQKLRPALTQTEVDVIIAASDGEESDEQIAARLGVNVNSVIRLLDGVEAARSALRSGTVDGR